MNLLLLSFNCIYEHADDLLQEELMSLKMKEAEYAVHVRELDDRNMQLELVSP